MPWSPKNILSNEKTPRVRDMREMREMCERAREKMQRIREATPPKRPAPPPCPACGGSVEPVTVGFQRTTCGGCGSVKQTVALNGNSMNADELTPLATGLLLGAALATLFCRMVNDD